jgi:DNA-binding NtrC family response regulator
MRDDINILVVDDDLRMVKTICDILMIKGFKAVPAHSGEEAIEKVKSMELDCVLMDLKMPGINGIETLKAIKSLSPDLPVVMMSAYATEEQLTEAKGSGAYNILSKPVDVQQLLSFLSILRKEESVLIVDDDPQFCRTLKDILLARGYQVETESDPDKVLVHMELKYQLVVILDLKLGDADGVETLARIRARYPTKPVILATGFRDDMASSIEKGLRIGAHACIYKPYEAEELLGMIEEIHHLKLRTSLE